MAQLRREQRLQQCQQHITCTNTNMCHISGKCTRNGGSYAPSSNAELRSCTGRPVTARQYDSSMDTASSPRQIRVMTCHSRSTNTVSSPASRSARMKTTKISDQPTIAAKQSAFHLLPRVPCGLAHQIHTSAQSTARNCPEHPPGMTGMHETRGHKLFDRACRSTAPRVYGVLRRYAANWRALEAALLDRSLEAQRCT